MKPSNDLFLLIKSLTKSEKRYIKLSSDFQKGEKEYLRLFDTIEKQKEYDEVKTKKVLGVEATQFSFIKNYLYQQIIGHLQRMNMNASHYEELKNNLHAVRILYNKGLFKQSQKIVAKSLQLAETFEYFPILLELMQWEIQVLIRENNYPQLVVVYKKQDQIIDKLKNQYRYQQLYHRINNIKINRYAERSKKETDQINALIDKKELNTINHAFSFEAQMYFYRIHSLYHLINGNHKERYRQLKEEVTLIEADKEKIIENPEHYTNALFDLMIVQTELYKFDECEETINKSKALAATIKWPYLKARLLLTSITQEIINDTNQGMFEHARKLSDEFETNLVFFQTYLADNYTMVSYYCISNLCFYSGDFRKARFWLNKVIHYSSVHIRKDIRGFSKILDLILYFETGEDDLIEYKIKSTYYFLKSKERLFKLEDTIIRLLKKLPYVNTNAELSAAFVDARQELEVLCNTDPYEKTGLHYLDLISWLDSKIQKRPLMEVAKENFRKRLEGQMI